MEADMGGTEILQPLQLVFDKPPIEGYAKTVREYVWLCSCVLCASQQSLLRVFSWQLFTVQRRCVLQVFLMTDGEVMNTNDVVKEVARNAHSSRYAVGTYITLYTHVHT